MGGFPQTNSKSTVAVRTGGHYLIICWGESGTSSWVEIGVRNLWAGGDGSGCGVAWLDRSGWPSRSWAQAALGPKVCANTDVAYLVILYTSQSWEGGRVWGAGSRVRTWKDWRGGGCWPLPGQWLSLEPAAEGGPRNNGKSIALGSFGARRAPKRPTQDFFRGAPQAPTL